MHTSESSSGSVKPPPEDLELQSQSKSDQPQDNDVSKIGGSTAPNKGEVQTPPLLQFAVIMFALYIAMFLVALDRIIISTAVPKITDAFHSTKDIGWYGSAYTLAGCISQIFFGRIYQFFHNKAVFISGVLIFEAGSALCGAAPNSIALICGRAIAGFGASGVFSGTIVVMLPLVPLQKRPMYQGFMGAIFGICSVIGPLVGGAFTTNVHLTWRWCFYINLPIGGLSIFLITFFLHLKPPRFASLPFKTKLIRLDPIGNLLFIPAVVCLLLALEWGGSTYAWSSARIIVLLILAGLLFIGWIISQAKGGANATVPPHIFLQRSVLAGFFFCMSIGGTMLVIGYYIAIWFQAIQGVDALESGIRSIPFVLALVVASIISGGFVSKVGYYCPPILLCTVLVSIGTGLLTTLKVDSGKSAWIGYQVIAGLGTGLGMQLPGVAVQVVLSDADVPIGTALMFFGNQLGGSIFMCVAQTVFLGGLIKDLGKVVGSETADMLANTGATEIRSLVSTDLLAAVLKQYNKATVTTFYVGTAIAAVSIVPAVLFEWKSVKKGKALEKGQDVEAAVSETKEETK